MKPQSFLVLPSRFSLRFILQKQLASGKLHKMKESLSSRKKTIKVYTFSMSAIQWAWMKITCAIPWTHSTPLVMYTCGTVFITMALWRGNSNWPRILSIQCHHKLPRFLSSDSVQPSLEKYRTIYPRDLHLTFTLNVNHKMENMFLRSCIVAVG